MLHAVKNFGADGDQSATFQPGSATVTTLHSRHESRGAGKAERQDAKRNRSGPTGLLLFPAMLLLILKECMTQLLLFQRKQSPSLT